jgi:hypothetical protein
MHVPGADRQQERWIRLRRDRPVDQLESRSGRRIFAGTGGYIDCVGLVVKKYSATEIVVAPGCQYGYYAKLINGAALTVTVNGQHLVTKAHFA